MLWGGRTVAPELKGLHAQGETVERYTDLQTCNQACEYSAMMSLVRWEAKQIKIRKSKTHILRGKDSV
jgi:hypothetical protein